MEHEGTTTHVRPDVHGGALFCYFLPWFTGLELTGLLTPFIHEEVSEVFDMTTAVLTLGTGIRQGDKFKD